MTAVILALPVLLADATPDMGWPAATAAVAGSLLAAWNVWLTYRSSQNSLKLKELEEEHAGCRKEIAALKKQNGEQAEELVRLRGLVEYFDRMTRPN